MFIDAIIYYLSNSHKIEQILQKKINQLNTGFAKDQLEIKIDGTPLAIQEPKSIIEEVDDGYNKISKILVWEQDQENQPNSGSGNISQNDQQQAFSGKEAQIPKQKMENRQNQQRLDNAQIIQKAGQNININVDVNINIKKAKQRKKNLQKRIRIEQPENKKKIICNCKKTKCLKLYCDCFRENQVCGSDCNCTGCHNTDQYQQQRYNSMLSLIQRNPEAFRPKLEAEQHAKGCNCKRSGCTKKYCECFQAGLSCGKNCKCEQCKNCKQEEHANKKQDFIMLMEEKDMGVQNPNQNEKQK